MKNTKSDLVDGNRQTKSRERVSQHGEVFTADREVNAMLNLVQQETERIDSRFLEPACGNGNFLAKILERKLSVVSKRYGKSCHDYELNSLIAISSLYGIDILDDNVQECRERLYHIFLDEYSRLFPHVCDEEVSDFLQSIRYIIHKNILCGDALTLLTTDGKRPIVFAEWSAIKDMIKRRDFTLDNLLRNQPMDGPNLFSDLGDKAFIPTPVAEYPLIHFSKIHTYADQ